MKMVLLIGLLFFQSSLMASEFNPYIHDQYDEINFGTFRLASESMSAFMDSIKQYLIYTELWVVPGAMEAGVGYYYDEKSKKLKKNIFHRIKETVAGIETERRLDFAVEGKGFFVIQLPGGWPAYTKDGRFEIDHHDRLVTMADGFPVLGENGPIYLPSDDIMVDEQGVITFQNEVIDVFRLEWFNDLFALRSFNSVIFYLSKEDYDLGTKFAQTDCFIHQGRLLQSGIEKEHLGRVMEWKAGHEAQSILLKAYSKNLRASIQQLGFQ